MYLQVEGRAERELQSLHDAVYDQALVWVNSLKAEQKQRIEGHFGPMPRKDPELQVQTDFFGMNTQHPSEDVYCMEVGLYVAL